MKKHTYILKRIVWTLMAFTCFLAAQAQSHYDSRIYVGGHAGVSASKVFFNPTVRQTLGIGETAGVAIRYSEENHFGLQAEINWIQRGWKENFEELPYNYRRTLNYVEVPVFAHIYFGNRYRFFLNAGPEVSFMIGESTKANFDPENTASLPDFPNTNRTNPQMKMPVKNKIDYGISLGLGGEFFINPRNSLTVEARAYYGLGNIFSAKRSDTFSTSNQLSFCATLGYFFRVK